LNQSEMNDAPVLFLINSASDLDSIEPPDADWRIVWLGQSPVPESLRPQQAVPAPDPDLRLIDVTLALKRWADEPTANGRSVKQLLEYDGVSLWWFVEAWLVSGWCVPSLTRACLVFQRLKAAVHLCRPREIVLLSGSAEDDDVARRVAEFVSVPYRWSIAPWRRHWRRRKLWTAAPNISHLRLAKLFLRGWLARRMRRDRVEFTGSLDFVCNAGSTTMRLPQGRDRLLQPLLDRALSQSRNFAVLHLDFRKSLGLDSLRRLPAYVVAWEAFCTLAAFRKARRACDDIARQWPDTTPGNFMGVPASVLLGPRISLLFACRVRDAVLALQMADTAITRLRPRCILVQDEYDMWGRALITAARRAGIRTIAVQHGLIEDNHEGYAHLEQEIAPDGRESSPYCPLPHVTAVYGIRSQQFLRERSHYPAGSVVVTGALPLEEAQTTMGTREEVRGQLAISDGAFAAVFFGAPSHIHPVDDQHLVAVLSLAGRVPGLVLVLRPHPLDAGGQRRYRSAMLRAGVPERVVVDRSAWDLIAAADVVISYTSSVAIDACALQRPSIHLNLSGSPDTFSFVDDGIAVGARSAGQLLESMSAIRDREFAKRLIARQTRASEELFATNVTPSESILQLAEYAYQP
jgi:hypothetical protein